MNMKVMAEPTRKGVVLNIEGNTGSVVVTVPLKWGLAYKSAILLNNRDAKFKKAVYDGESFSFEVRDDYGEVHGVFDPNEAYLFGQAKYIAEGIDGGMKGVSRVIEGILMRQTKMGKMDSDVPTIYEVLTKMGKKEGVVNYIIKMDGEGKIKHIKIEVEGETIEWEEEEGASYLPL
ncbi:protein of unknown function (plasmid) [Thermococcus nautili]|nr:protein of unknown function [Thermococcus nautili]